MVVIIHDSIKINKKVPKLFESTLYFWTMQLLCGALPASRRNEALVISRNHCLVLPGQVKGKILAFSFQPVATCHKTGLCPKIHCLCEIILAFCDTGSGLGFVCGGFFPHYGSFFVFFLLSLVCSSPCTTYRNPSLKQQLFSYAILGFALSEAMGLFCLMVAFLILFAMWQLLVLAAASITLSSAVWVCFHQSVPDWQLKKRFL